MHNALKKRRVNPNKRIRGETKNEKGGKKRSKREEEEEETKAEEEKKDILLLLSLAMRNLHRSGKICACPLSWWLPHLGRYIGIAAECSCLLYSLFL
jgi:hypothetical protein